VQQIGERALHTARDQHHMYELTIGSYESLAIRVTNTVASYQANKMI